MRGGPPETRGRDFKGMRRVSYSLLPSSPLFPGQRGESPEEKAESLKRQMTHSGNKAEVVH